jgi:hypothetical protein
MVAIEDRIYGSSEIRDSVLLELIDSAPLQRLKGVSQHGYPEETKTAFPHYTRYEHSVGVMLLLKTLGAGLEEQVAGLLHDVSHTAFSHIVDWLFGDPYKEDYQDSMLKECIQNSALGSILTKHGFDTDAISGMERNGKYTLLERDAPDLCADRIDYALRDSYCFFRAEVKKCISNITVCDREIAFVSRAAARQFGEWYMKCQKELWASNEARLRYYLISEALRTAMDKRILKKDDLYKDESAIIGMLRASRDRDVVDKLETGLGELRFVVSENGPIELKKKIRYVDPKFLSDGTLIKLSKVDDDYRKLVEEERSRLLKPVRVELVR